MGSTQGQGQPSTYCNFNNMQTLTFKPQLTVYVFRCHQSSKWTSRETEVHFSFVIGGFRSILFVSVFQSSLAVAIILIDGSENPNIIVSWALNFRVRMLLKDAKKTS